MGGYGNSGKFPDPSVLSFSARLQAFAIRHLSIRRSGCRFVPRQHPREQEVYEITVQTYYRLYRST